MVNVSAESWNKAGVSIIKGHENDDVNKTILLLLCISDTRRRWDGKNTYGRIDKEIKGKYNVKKMSELTKQQIRKYKIDRSRLMKGSKESLYISEVIAIAIRQIMIKEYLNCKFHRINPDVKGFGIFLEIGKMQNYITQSNEEKLRSKLVQELLNYISSISKPLKYIRYFVEKIAPTV